MSPQDVLAFWFAPEHRKRWFRPTPEFDAAVRERLLGPHRSARAGRLEHWRSTPEGALALAILLDQVPLNAFRGRAAAFADGAAAVMVARRAVEQGLDRELADEQKVFLYMPLMHSEALEDQDRAVELFEKAGLGDNARWARHHRSIVRRFGRFPHRNAILGRASTTAEEAWLAEPGSFKG